MNYKLYIFTVGKVREGNKAAIIVMIDVASSKIIIIILPSGIAGVG
jgi:hypothetical protein